MPSPTTRVSERNRFLVFVVFILSGLVPVAFSEKSDGLPSSAEVSSPTPLDPNEEVLLTGSGNQKWQERFVVRRRDIALLANWNPTSGAPPPLSLEACLREVRPEIAKLVKGWPWKIESVCLSQGLGDETKKVWFYEIRVCLDVSPTGRSENLKYVTVVVPMDGAMQLSDPGIPDRPADAKKFEPFDSGPSEVPGQLRLTLSGSHNVEEIYQISEEDAASLPAWTPMDSDAPPMDFSKPLAQLRKRVLRRFPGEEWRIVQINLRSGGFAESKDIWFYEALLFHWPKGNRDAEELWTHCFLLDGTILSSEPDLPQNSPQGATAEPAAKTRKNSE